jgi:hypothetical protein
MAPNEQLSFYDNSPEQLRLLHRLKRTDGLRAALKFLGYSNQKFHFADEELRKLRSNNNFEVITIKLELGRQVLDIVTDELYGINIFREGLQDINTEDYPLELQNIFAQEEFINARNYVNDALKYDKISSNKRDDGCFYCHQTIKAQCLLPKLPSEQRDSIFRFCFFNDESRNEFKKKLKIDPDIICCPR